MADATCISRVLDIVEAAAAGDRVVLVLSAIKGCTDALIEAGRLPAGERDRALAPMYLRHRDIIDRLFTGDQARDAIEEVCALLDAAAAEPDGDTCQTYGELLSTRIVDRKLTLEGNRTAWLDSRELIVRDNPDESYARICKAVESRPDVKIFVAPGFVASDASGRVCTLGRGGSDLSAALYAAALDAESLQIWTDVPGVMTTNPREVPAARTIEAMSYDLAFRMAENGAKVLYAPTVLPARKAGIDITILDTFHPDGGSTVISAGAGAPGGAFSGICRMGGKLYLAAEGGIDTAWEEAACLRTLERAGIEGRVLEAAGDHILLEVPEGNATLALKALHREFFEKESNTVEIYLAGCGAVGSALCELLESNAERIEAQSGARFVLKAVARHESEDQALIEALMKPGSARKVFVDCTNSKTIHHCYIPVLEAGVDIVSSNRRALAVPYAEYAAIKAAALRSGAALRYETTVGTSLPMLGPLATAASGGDRIRSLEAVVSCTLNRIFSSGEDFCAALKKAHDEGLTEKDPRTDLGGVDALRKLLILSREAGIPLDADDVEIKPVLPEEFFEGSVEEFYSRLEAAAPKFGTDLRFVASLAADPAAPKGYKAFIGVRAVGPDHPARTITGTDNAIIMYSDFHTSPLVIRGSGEGARGAAASVLHDILR